MFDIGRFYYKSNNLENSDNEKGIYGYKLASLAGWVISSHVKIGIGKAKLIHGLPAAEDIIYTHWKQLVISYF